MRMRTDPRREDRKEGGGRDRGRDSGQVTVEFLGMTPTILITLVVLWQLVLVGYTWTLAGNAADEAVRAGTAAEGDMQARCAEAGLKDLSGAWQGGADVRCGAGGGYVTADVRIEVPILFPGTVSFPFTVQGHAGAVEEATH
ncbi:TadE/TadG family type IV pilus assembly protein [Streptomyces sp. NPDC020490]|uniref:TadE/TadG family type IV pilus assembly protein n=1 Tax=Streptomyces sp. NPDC020490 TaxID=3365078 RepID=UPI0037A8D36D